MQKNEPLPSPCRAEHSTPNAPKTLTQDKTLDLLEGSGASTSWCRQSQGLSEEDSSDQENGTDWKKEQQEIKRCHLVFMDGVSDHHI